MAVKFNSSGGGSVTVDAPVTASNLTVTLPSSSWTLATTDGGNTTFTSITDSGNLTFTGTGNRITGDFSNATIANRVAFQTSTTDGNTIVGFIPNGTSTQSRLNIFNNADTTNYSVGSLLISSTEVRLISDAAGTGTQLPMTFYTSGSERMRIDTSGNVGIGATPSGTYKLEVAGAATFAGNTLLSTGYFRTVDGGSAATPSIQPGNDVDTGMYWVGANQIGFAAGGSNVFNIATGGAWASGATPSLYATGTSNSSVSAVSGSYSLALTQYVTGESYCQTNGGPLYFGTTGAQQISFRTNATEVMALTSAGYLLIGTTSTSTSVPGIWGGYNYSSGSGYGRLNFIKGTASGTGSTTALGFYYNGATVGSIVCTSTATAFNTSSDYRLKEEVQPMNGALEKLALVKPVTFKWKSSGEAAQGFIAHELQEVFPDAVSGKKDGTEFVDEMDDEGRVIGQKEVPLYQGVDSSFLVATLVRAVQELQEKLNEVQSELAALKSA